MKLKIEHGELTLPKDFSFEIEQNSAFFSDEGAASLAATIPATPSDLARLGYPTRPGRDTRYRNLFPAIIDAGVFQKKGQLIVESASEDGISCAVALEDSDFYSRFKERNLKELFSAKVLTTYSDPASWYPWIKSVYEGAAESDFRIFPVAVNYDETDFSYQVNNCPVYDAENAGIYALEHETRLVKEGSDSVSVPEGYGISPFLKLYRFFEILFELCGYSVRTNCFRSHEILKNFVLVNNCSDVLCNGRIDYSDLVPNKTVSDILEWMKNKFHAQIVARPADASIDILLLEDIIRGDDFDLDITDRILGHETYFFSRSSRIVLAPDVSLSGAAPAAETKEALKQKYGSCKEVSETGWCYAPMGLVLRRSTGAYYEIHTSFSGRTGKIAKRVGTNYFKYDRRNSEDQEEINAEDLIPPMVFAEGFLMPYIGERKHRNTSYNNSRKDEEQEIIICDYAGLSTVFDGMDTSDPDFTAGSGRLPSVTGYGGHYYYGTTQAYDNAGKLRPGRIAMTAEGLFPLFWRLYNKILLNDRIEVEGRFDLSIEELLKFNLYALKLFHGQPLLPKSISYEVGKKIRCLSFRSVLVKDFEDQEEDTDTVMPEPQFRWVLNSSNIESRKQQLSQSSGKEISAKYSDEDPYKSGAKDVFLVAPTAAGLRSPEVIRKVDFQYFSGTPRTPAYTTLATEDVSEWYDSVPMS